MLINAYMVRMVSIQLLHCFHCRPYEKTFDNWFGGFTPCFVDVILLGALPCCMHDLGKASVVTDSWDFTEIR
jgi:hypothetical protein